MAEPARRAPARRAARAKPLMADSDTEEEEPPEDDSEPPPPPTVRPLKQAPPRAAPKPAAARPAAPQPPPKPKPKPEKEAAPEAALAPPPKQKAAPAPSRPRPRGGFMVREVSGDEDDAEETAADKRLRPVRRPKVPSPLPPPAPPSPPIAKEEEGEDLAMADAVGEDDSESSEQEMRKGGRSRR
jgi:hypothetical protein